MLVGLLDLADSYCEVRLKEVCEELIWQQVSVENVAMLIARATKYKIEVCIVIHDSILLSSLT